MRDISAYQRLLTMWQEEDIPLESAFSLNEVTELLSVNGIRPSRDAVEFYTLIGGMQYGYSDKKHFELWGRAEIREYNDANSNYLWIGQWLCFSHLYAIKRVDDHHSAVYIGDDPDRTNVTELIANSLYEFADRLVDDPTSLEIF